jgi:hypothetical protein
MAAALLGLGGCGAVVAGAVAAFVWSAGGGGGGRPQLPALEVRPVTKDPNAPERLSVPFVMTGSGKLRARIEYEVVRGLSGDAVPDGCAECTEVEGTQRCRATPVGGENPMEVTSGVAATFVWDAGADLLRCFGIESAEVCVFVVPMRGDREGEAESAPEVPPAGNTATSLRGVTDAGGNDVFVASTQRDDAGRVSVEVFFRILDAESDACSLSQVDMFVAGGPRVPVNPASFNCGGGLRSAPPPEGLIQSCRFFLDELPSDLRQVQGAGFFGDLCIRLQARDYPSVVPTDTTDCVRIDLNEQPAADLAAVVVDFPSSGVIPIRYRLLDADRDSPGSSDPEMADVIVGFNRAAGAAFQLADELPLVASRGRRGLPTLGFSAVGQPGSTEQVFLWDALASLGDLPAVVTFSLRTEDHETAGDEERTGPPASAPLVFDTFSPLVPGGTVLVGVAPVTAVSGDFDGDGIDDLAVSNRGSRGVSFLEGNAGGGLVVRTLVPVGGTPRTQLRRPLTLAAADFDGDGADDVAVALDGRQLAFLSGAVGSGLVDDPERRRRDALSGVPVALRSADVDADGVEDLLVVTAGPDAFLLVRGGRGGFFDLSQDFDPASLPVFPLGQGVVGNESDVAVRDFDGDGLVDAVVSLPGPNANAVAFVPALVRGPGFRVCDSLAVGARPGALAAADFDGDGRDEVVVASQDGNSVNFVRAMLGGGPACLSLVAEVSLGEGRLPFDLAVADFDADGVLDVAVLNFLSQTVSLIRGLLPSPQVLVELPTGIEPTAIATGDFDADGFPDVVVSNRTDEDVAYFRGAAPPRHLRSAGRVPASNGPEALACGDFNADGLIDFAAVNRLSNDVSVIPGATGGLASAAELEAGDGPTVALSADFDNDGLFDLLVGNAGDDDELAYYRGTVAGLALPLGERVLSARFARSIAGGDLNDDGFPDALVVSARGAALPKVVFVPGGPVGLESAAVQVLDLVLGTQEFGNSVVCGNFDGDMSLEAVVLVTGSETGRLFRVEGGPAGPVLIQDDFLPLPCAPGEGALARADFNADGLDDVAVGLVCGAVLCVRGTADGLDFLNPVVAGGLASGMPLAIAADDFDRDGFADLLVANTGANAAALLLGGDDGLVEDEARRREFVVLGEPAAIATGDFNADGLPDAALALRDANAVRVLSGAGSGLDLTGGVSGSFPVGSRPIALLSADLNADGFTDIVCVNEESDDITFLRGSVRGLRAERSYPTGDAPSALAAGDFNGDGFADLAVANLESDSVSTFRQRFLVPHASVFLDAVALQAGSPPPALEDPRRPPRYRLELPPRPFAAPAQVAILPAESFPVVRSLTAGSFVFITETAALLREGQPILVGATRCAVLTLRLRDDDPVLFADAIAHPERLQVHRRDPASGRGELVQDATAGLRIADFGGGRGAAFPISRLGTYAVILLRP